jgi:hypothetical protein
MWRRTCEFFVWIFLTFQNVSNITFQNVSNISTLLYSFLPSLFSVLVANVRERLSYIVDIYINRVMS